MWLVWGKNPVGELAGEEILDVFSVSSCLTVCQSGFSLDWGLRICAIRSSTHYITHYNTLYSTIEHAATILRVSMTPAELRQGLSLCLAQRARWIESSSWPLESDSSSSSDSNVAARWLSVVVTMLYGKNGNQGIRIAVLQVVVTLV